MEENNYSFAFLNYGRPLDNVIATYQLLFAKWPLATYIFASNKTDQEVCDAGLIKNNSHYIQLDKSPTVAAGKNKILRYAQEKQLKTLFILEDDILIDDVTVIEDYMVILKKYELGLVFFGFGGQINHVFHKANPRLVFTKEGQMPVMFNSMPCGALMLFNLETNKELFREELKYHDLKEYMVRLKGKNLIPFLGIYMDAYNSFQRLHTVKMDSCRPKNAVESIIEGEVLRRAGMQYQVEGSIDAIIAFLKSKQSLK
jgi:hypothetical protein